MRRRTVILIAIAAGVLAVAAIPSPATAADPQATTSPGSITQAQPAASQPQPAPSAARPALAQSQPAVAQEKADGRLLVVGSKKFTESVILGEMVVSLLEDARFPCRHQKELGGTRLLWDALLAGRIDVYPEYTGTISEEILAGQDVEGEEKLPAALAGMGVGMSAPLGFNNTYAIGMKRDVADRLGVLTISDLARHPELRLGFSNEFMDRGDGWPSLRDAYRLPQADVRGLDHDLAYRGLAAGSIDATDLYSTDAEIRYYDLRTLRDDRGHFPVYNAVLVYRLDLPPTAVAAISRLAGLISEEQMIAMSAAVKLDRRSEHEVAGGFLRDQLGIASRVQATSWAARLAQRTREHLELVGISLAAAVAVALPLGIVAARHRRAGQVILGAVGVVQTIPSLALLVFMIPLLGIGAVPAMAALFLYSLLPVVRNTHAGLHDIPGPLRESAEALGLGERARLRLVELPMASRAILAGVKTSAVINVGTATLGALVGAGGYGQPILTGIRLDNVGLILEGAIPAAGMALAAQGVFELLERVVVPKGLRLSPQG